MDILAAFIFSLFEVIFGSISWKLIMFLSIILVGCVGLYFALHSNSFWGLLWFIVCLGISTGMIISFFKSNAKQL